MSDVSNKSSGGISAFTLLFFIFLVLKLTGKIGWSWLWVTAPLWGSFCLGIFLLLLYLIVVAATK